jgi:hypothetical protein
MYRSKQERLECLKLIGRNFKVDASVRYLGFGSVV